MMNNCLRSLLSTLKNSHFHKQISTKIFAYQALQSIKVYNLPFTQRLVYNFSELKPNDPNEALKK